MSVKAILVLCTQALLLKSALGQLCTSRAAVADISKLAAPCSLAAPAWAYDGLAYPGTGLAGKSLAIDGLATGYAGRSLAYDRIVAPTMEFSSTSGGALLVSSASAIAPVGISIVSDNAYEGILAVEGESPFVSTIAMEGVVPSAGSGAVNHACGDGRNAMISETAAFAPAATLGSLAAYGPGAAIAPADLVGPGIELRGGWAGRGCGCGI